MLLVVVCSPPVAAAPANGTTDTLENVKKETSGSIQGESIILSSQGDT